MEIFVSLILAGLSVSFFHAILPNHWLPFVLAGRAQRWSMGKTLSIVTLAGGGHVLITTCLGVFIVWSGLALASYVEAWAVPLASGVLVLLGLYYIVQHVRGSGHGHAHFSGFHHQTSHDHAVDDGHNHGCEDGHSHGGACDHAHGSDHSQWEERSCDHAHGSDHAHEEERSGRGFSPDTVAVASLIALLTFSPCEGFLPIYLTAWPYGWTAFAVLSVVLAVGTLAGMLIFTGLAFAGVRRMEVPWLERYERLIFGGVLILLGAAVVVFHL